MAYFDQLLSQAEANDMEKAAGFVMPAASAKSTATDNFFRLVRQAEANDAAKRGGVDLAEEGFGYMTRPTSAQAGRAGRWQ